MNAGNGYFQRISLIWYLDTQFQYLFDILYFDMQSSYLFNFAKVIFKFNMEEEIDLILNTNEASSASTSTPFLAEASLILQFIFPPTQCLSLYFAGFSLYNWNVDCNVDYDSRVLLFIFSIVLWWGTCIRWGKYSKQTQSKISMASDPSTPLTCLYNTWMSIHLNTHIISY